MSNSTKGINIFDGYTDIKSDTQTEIEPGAWVTARPHGLFHILHRVRCAWRVLIGDADIVTWNYRYRRDK